MSRKNNVPERIGSIVEEILAQRGYLSICKEFDIMRQWPEIVDERFAAMSRAERIENGILYVKVSSAPWRQEAIYRREAVLERIRNEFGCPTVKNIVFY